MVIFILCFLTIARKIVTTLTFAKQELLIPIVKVSEQMKVLAQGHFDSRLDLPEDVIEQFLRIGKTHLRGEILESMNAIARGYVSGLFDALRAHGYDPRMMKLYVLGGGGCLVKRFGKYDPESVIFVDNLNAAARGYEYMAQGLLWAKEKRAK